MLRRLAVLFVLAVSVLTGCSAPRTEAGGRSVVYTPTTVGDKWVMVEEGGPAALEETHEVTAVESKDGAIFVTETVKRRRAETVVLRRVSDTGEYLLQEGKTLYDPPIRVLPAPIKEGNRWHWEKPGIVKWTYTAGKEEEVEVPAGKFKALRIEGEGQSEGKPVKCTQWLAPGTRPSRSFFESAVTKSSKSSSLSHPVRSNGID